MTGKTMLVGAAVLIAAVATTAAMAAGSAKGPKKLVLRPSDFPSGTTGAQTFTAPGTIGKSYSITFNFHAGTREEEVTSEVTVATNAANAAHVYAIVVGGNTGLEGDTIVRLPSYGDRQTADFFLGPLRGGARRARGEVIVRRRNVVWQLTVESCGPYAPAGCLGGVTPPDLTKAQAIAELKKYAPKQKARVGNG